MSKLNAVTIIDAQKVVCEHKLVDQIYQECEKISQGQDTYAENYSVKGLALLDHLAFDVLYDDQGEIAGWCGLFNGGRYPDGVFRIMNRLYIAPHFRTTYFKVPITRRLYHNQIKRHEDKIKMLFLSRNELKGRHHVERWATKNSGEEGWVVSDGLVQVVEGKRKGCYQYIAYKKFDPTIKWPNVTISENDWLKLED